MNTLTLKEITAYYSVNPTDERVNGYDFYLMERIAEEYAKQESIQILEYALATSAQ